MEPIFEAVLANDPSRITAAAAAQRMEEDLFIAELHHMLYRGDTPLHLAAAGLRYDAARALLAAGTPSTRSTAAARRRCITPAIPGRCRRRGIRAPNGASSSCWSPPEQQLTSRTAAGYRPSTARYAPEARPPLPPCCPPAPTRTPRPARQARPRCTWRSHRPARAEPPESATSSSRSSGCSSPPAQQWPTWIAAA